MENIASQSRFTLIKNVGNVGFLCRQVMGWDRMVQQNTGHITITYRFRLYEKHTEWFAITQELYNAVVAHYYGILRDRPQLMVLSGHELLRELERMSVGTKESKKTGNTPEYPLEGFPKIPLYFRRAAINSAAGLMRAYQGRVRFWEREQAKGRVGSEPAHPDSFQMSPLYYKGMYREWKDSSIELKLYDGEKWQWSRYRYKGRRLPEGAVRQSPTLVLQKKSVELHVPVELPVFDIRTVKERMQTEEKICAVSFPDYDVLAAAVLMDRQGKVLEEKNFRGGDAREGQRQEILKKLEKSRRSRGRVTEEGRQTNGETGRMPETEGQENARLYEKLKEINRFHSHRISSEITKYCVDAGIKLIVVPDYGGAIDFSDKRYLKTDAYRWQGRSMIKNLRYKAYREGMVVTAVSTRHTADRCSECGAEIKRYNEGHSAGQRYYGGRLYVCPNGHKGNTAVNTAKNVGRYFLRGYPVIPDELE